MNVDVKEATSDDRNEVYEINRTAFGRDDEAKRVDLLRESTAFVPILRSSRFVT